MGSNQKRLKKKLSKFGKETINYRLRNWGVSRQRSWGAPIPMMISKNDPQKVIPFSELNESLKGEEEPKINGEIFIKRQRYL